MSNFPTYEDLSISLFPNSQWFHWYRDIKYAQMQHNMKTIQKSYLHYVQYKLQETTAKQASQEYLEIY